MRSFIQQHLDPANRLGEVLFGLIMALGFTGAVRLGLEEADNRAMFIGILGCNLAWAIVDGVMYVLAALFERGRKARLARDVLAAPTEDGSLRLIGDELNERIGLLTTPEERGRIQHWVLKNLRREKLEPPGLHREDLLGGVAVALVIVLATLPVVVPYLVMSNPNLAVRASNLIALALLFLVGVAWGRVVGVSPFRIAAGLTLVGMTLVLVTIVLGG